MKKKGALNAIATVTVFGIFTRGLAFIFKIYLSRTLGAEAIGVYQIAVSVFYLFASFSSSGIPLVLSRKTAEHDAVGGEPDFSLFSSALFLGLILSLSTIGILTIIRGKLDFLFAEPLALPLFLVMIPALLSTAVYGVVRGWFWGRKKFAIFSVTETLEEGLRILFSVIFIGGAVAGLSGVYAVAAAFTVSDMTVAVILFALYLAKGGKIKKPENLKRLLVPSLPVTVMRMFASLTGTLIAFILPLRLITFGMPPSEATASYGRIAGMANPLLFAPNAIIGSLAIVLIPEMSANRVRKEFSLLNRHLNNGIGFAFLISGLFMTVYVALGEEITVFLYDDAPSGIYLQYAAYLMLPMAFSQLTQSAINSIGKEYRAFGNYLVGNVFMIAALLILPKHMGIYSVAAATMLSLLATSALNAFTLRKYTGFPFRFVKYAVMVTLFLFPSALLADCVQSLLRPKLKLFALFFSAPAGMAMYVLLCLHTDLVAVKGFLKLRKKAYRAR